METSDCSQTFVCHCDECCGVVELKAELDRYKKALGVAMGYFQELDGFQVLSAQDFKLPKEIANMAQKEINRILGKEEGE